MPKKKTVKKRAARSTASPKQILDAAEKGMFLYLRSALADTSIKAGRDIHGNTTIQITHPDAAIVRSIAAVLLCIGKGED